MEGMTQTLSRARYAKQVRPPTLLAMTIHRRDCCTPTRSRRAGRPKAPRATTSAPTSADARSSAPTASGPGTPRRTTERRLGFVLQSGVTALIPLGFKARIPVGHRSADSAAQRNELQEGTADPERARHDRLGLSRRVDGDRAESDADADLASSTASGSRRWCWRATRCWRSSRGASAVSTSRVGGFGSTGH